MQKVLSSSQIGAIHSQLAVDALGARFLNVCHCANCGKVGDVFHDETACRDSDYVQWRAMRDAELFELRFDELPEIEEGEEEENAPEITDDMFFGARWLYN